MSSDQAELKQSRSVPDIGILKSWSFKNLSSPFHSSVKSFRQACTWGWGGNGQLGCNDLNNSSAPRWLSSLSDCCIQQISCGTRFTVFLTSKGTIYVTGKNDHGQLGLGDYNNRTTPHIINVNAFVGSITNISAKGAHVIAKTHGADIYTWGRGLEGQLGHGDIPGLATPRRVKLPSISVVNVAAGRLHSMIVDGEGHVYTTGCNDDGQLGHGNHLSISLFKRVEGLKCVKITHIAVGSRHNIVLSNQRQLFSWGANSYGQCGVFPNKTHLMQPVALKDLKDVTQIYCGYRHSMAVTTASQVYGWGWNTFGQLGISGRGRCPEPKKINALDPISRRNAALSLSPRPSGSPQTRHQIIDIALGGKHSLVLAEKRVAGREETVVYSFGKGDDGQLGHGSQTGSLIPLEMSTLNDEVVLAVGAGWCHSAAITSRGTKKRKQTKVPFIVRGDIDGFLGLFMNSVIQLMLIETLWSNLGDSKISSKYILPSVGLVSFFGNSVFALQAWCITKRTGQNITAQPFGLNVVLILSYTVLIMKPVYTQTNDPILAWRIGTFACFVTGAIECVGAFFISSVRNLIPKAAMLSSIGGIALSFIAMQFAFDVFNNPAIAFLPLMIIFIAYGSGIQFPLKLPGALASILVGLVLTWGSRALGYDFFTSPAKPYVFNLYSPSPSGFIFELLGSSTTWKYINVILPMTIFNMVQNLVNIESAKHVGNSFPVASSLLVSGVGNMFSALLGNPYPGCIFIGHPVFKCMGARFSYTLGNGIVIAFLCFISGGSLILQVMPMDIAVGILLWVGIVMTSSAFEGGTSPTKSFGPAVGIGFVPALASWLLSMIQTICAANGTTIQESIQKGSFRGRLPIHGVIALSQGFLLTSLVLASSMVFIIEREFLKASAWMMIGTGLSMIGMIHAYEITPLGIETVFSFFAAPCFAFGYFSTAIFLVILHFMITEEDTGTFKALLKRYLSKMNGKQSNKDTEKNGLISDIPAKTYHSIQTP